MESKEQTCQGCSDIEKRVVDLEKQIVELKITLGREIKLSETRREIHESLTNIKKRILEILSLTSDKQFEEIFSFDPKINKHEALRNYRFKNPGVWTNETYGAFGDQYQAKKEKYHDVVNGLYRIEKRYMVPFKHLLCIIRLSETPHEYEYTGNEEAWIENLNPLCNSE